MKNKSSTFSYFQLGHALLKGNSTVCRGCNTAGMNILGVMEQQNRVCNSLKLGDDTLRTLGQDPKLNLPADLSNENPPFCCIQWCDDKFNFQDFETRNVGFNPCFIAYQGSFIESIVSILTSLIEPARENDREVCRFSDMNDDKNRCVSKISRLCRTDR